METSRLITLCKLLAGKCTPHNQGRKICLPRLELCKEPVGVFWQAIRSLDAPLLMFSKTLGLSVANEALFLASTFFYSLATFSSIR